MSEPWQGAQYNGAILIQDAGPTGMITLRGDLGGAPVQKALKGETGLDLPGALEVVSNDSHTLAWFSPDELLILLPHAEADAMVANLSRHLAAHHHLALNVSDARVMFDLSGRALADVLAKLTPADMSPAAFGPGTCRRTRLAQAPVAIWSRAPGRAQLVCFRSVAEYVHGVLTNAARPGADVGFHDAR